MDKAAQMGANETKTKYHTIVSIYCFQCGKPYVLCAIRAHAFCLDESEIVTVIITFKNRKNFVHKSLFINKLQRRESIIFGPMTGDVFH